MRREMSVGDREVRFADFVLILSDEEEAKSFELGLTWSEKMKSVVRFTQDETCALPTRAPHVLMLTLPLRNDVYPVLQMTVNLRFAHVLAISASHRRRCY